MKIATNWKDYKVLKTANGEKLECIGGFSFLRPDPQVIWNVDKSLSTKALSAPLANRTSATQ